MLSQLERERVQELVDKANGKVFSAPCQVACPLGVDIQRSHVLLSQLSFDSKKAHRQINKIGDKLYEKNPLFPIAGYVCGLCEQGCNYKDETGSVRRRLLVRFVADHYLKALSDKPALPRPTKDKVGVVGGGPAGLMAAYSLSKRGYKVTLFERSSELGGALNLIPRYRLPRNVLYASINNLVRIAHVDARLNTAVGDDGRDLAALEAEGYKAMFIATGTPIPRPLTFGRDLVEGTDLDGVMFGLDLLSDVNQGKPHLFQGKRVLVIGGGNVAFDTARVAQRLGGKVSLVCLEGKDKDSRDGIPADEEEVEGASEEQIEIVYGRGVSTVIGDNGKFKGIECPRCTSVFDEHGRFQPEFDLGDVKHLDGDFLLVSIGQGPERMLFEQAGLLSERGRLDADPITLQSERTPWVFMGGDARRPGFATEAMQEGAVAAESIALYLSGDDTGSGRKKEYEGSPIPKLSDYKPQPEPRWKPAAERLNFEPFEEGFTPEEAIREATRCLYCGPCMSCKACVVLELRPELPEIEVNEERCSGCGVCVTVCPYDAAKLERTETGRVAIRDELRCKRCGICVSACPSGAVRITDGLEEAVDDAISHLAVA